MTTLPPIPDSIHEAAWQAWLDDEHTDAKPLLAHVLTAVWPDLYALARADMAEPRVITWDEMRPGMVVELRNVYTVESIGSGHTLSCGSGTYYLISDAPDPDADLIEAMARSIADEDCALSDWNLFPVDRRDAYRDLARAALAVVHEWTGDGR